MAVNGVEPSSDKLRNLEQSLEAFQSHLQKLLASSKQYAKTGSLQETFNFTEQLVEYGHKQDGDQGLAKFGNVLESIETTRGSLLEQMEISLKPTESFLKNDILSVLVIKRKVEKAKEEFEANQLKFDIIRSMVTSEKLAQYETTLADSKQVYEKLAATYSSKLEEIETRKKFEVMEPLARFLLGQLEFHRQSVQQLSQLEGSLRSSVEELKKQREKFLETHVVEPEIDSNLQALSKYGFLAVKESDNWEKRWVVVANGFLYIYRDWKDANTMSTHMLTSAVAKHLDSEIHVQITTPVPSTVTLQASNTEESVVWMNVIQNTATTLSALFKDKDNVTTNERFIKSNLFYISESNSVCADCGAKDPEFVLLRFGGLVCSQCATNHRKSGTSQTKSLFENKLEPEELHVLSVIGNEKVNSLFEHKISSTKHIAKPKEDAESEVKERYIRAKYDKKRFVQAPEGFDPASSVQALLSAINNNSFATILELLAWGVDSNAIVDSSQRSSLIHAVIQEGKANHACLAFLLHNDTTTYVQDASQRTPLHYAALKSLEGYIRLLVAIGGANLNTKDSEGRTAAMIVRTNSGVNAKTILPSIEGVEGLSLAAMKEGDRANSRSSNAPRNASLGEKKDSKTSSGRSTSVGVGTDSDKVAGSTLKNNGVSDGSGSSAASSSGGSATPVGGDSVAATPADGPQNGADQQGLSTNNGGNGSGGGNGGEDGAGTNDGESTVSNPAEKLREEMIKEILNLLLQSQQQKEAGRRGTTEEDGKKEEEERSAKLATLKSSVIDCADLLRARLNVLRQDLRNAGSTTSAMEIAETVHQLRLALLAE